MLCHSERIRGVGLAVLPSPQTVSRTFSTLWTINILCTAAVAEDVSRSHLTVYVRMTFFVTIPADILWSLTNLERVDS